MPYIGTAPSSELANLDINGQKFILDADADTSITADTDDTIDIEIAGADDFQFTANTFTAKSGSTIAAQALTGTTGIFSSDVTGLTLNATGDTAADDNAAIGYTSAEGLILTGQGSTNDVTIKNDADGDVLTIATGTTTATFAGDVTLPSAGELFIGDTSNGSQTAGITVNQGSADNEAFGLKSSDVAHGVTGWAETDTYFAIQKATGAFGGVWMSAMDDAGASTTAFNIVGLGGQVNTTKAAEGGSSTVNTWSYLNGGSGSSATISANGNIFSCIGQTDDGGKVQFIVDIEGELHSNGGAQSAYDEFDDAQMTRALDISRGKGVIDSKFDKFIAYNHEKLAELKLVGRELDGTPNHFINVTGMQRLHNGAIWQQYEKHENLLNAVYELAVEAVGEYKANKILDKHDIKLLSGTDLLN